MSQRGVDALMLETFSDLDAFWTVKYGCLPHLDSQQVPVLLSITYKKTSTGIMMTHGKQSPDAMARLARQYGVAAIGVNCGQDITMDDAVEIVRCHRKATDLPLFARPNAGTPVRGGEGWAYPHSPHHMAARLPDLLEAGVTMIGGCCGTTPQHIAAFRPIVEAWNARLVPGENI
jgi:methionine synthase I (cobalamin-dependent)